MKKKVAISTLLDVINFGTMLQAYALGRKLESFELDVQIINYWRPANTTMNKVKTFLKDESLGMWPKRFILAMGTMVCYPYLRKKHRRFVTKKFKMTKAYYSLDELKKNPPRADFFVTGSDQVWNSSYNGGIDRVFYLDFTDKPKISYASSVGMLSYPEEQVQEVKELLSAYKALSVRESQTCDYFKSLGFEHTEHVLDPTLLLSKEDWMKEVDCRVEKQEPYLLVYSVERFNNDFIFTQAHKIANAKGLKMYVVAGSYPVNAEKYGFDKIYALATTETFLRLMIGAEFVVASSFHGTAFALNFNKDFITIAANKFNIRMESLIKQFDISHRIVNDEYVEVSDLPPIDYSTVNKKLTVERARSEEYLKNAINLAIND